jgi:anti-sigma factor RsiW
MRFLRRKPKPISCQELVELVTDYLEGQLPGVDVRRFEAHIADCGNCAAYLEQIRESVAVVGTLSEETLPPGAAEALLAEFRDWKLARG